MLLRELREDADLLLLEALITKSSVAVKEDLLHRAGCLGNLSAMRGLSSCHRDVALFPGGPEPVGLHVVEEDPAHLRDGRQHWRRLGVRDQVVDILESGCKDPRSRAADRHDAAHDAHHRLPNGSCPFWRRRTGGHRGEQGTGKLDQALGASTI